MTLRVPSCISLQEAVSSVMKATGESENCVRAALAEAGLTGAINATGCLHLCSLPNPAKYFAYPVLNERETVPKQAWGATISWLESRIGRYDLVRLNRADIERWLVAAATNGNEQPREENPRLRAEPGNPQSKKRSQPQRDVVKRCLQKMFPDGLPSKDDLPDYKLLRKCNSLPDLKGISPDTIVRAMADLREEQQNTEPQARRIVK